jgi:hypothetical protein
MVFGGEAQFEDKKAAQFERGAALLEPLLKVVRCMSIAAAAGDKALAETLEPGCLSNFFSERAGSARVIVNAGESQVFVFLNSDLEYEIFHHEPFDPTGKLLDIGHMEKNQEIPAPEFALCFDEAMSSKVRLTIATAPITLPDTSRYLTHVYKLDPNLHRLRIDAGEPDLKIEITPGSGKKLTFQDLIKL